MPSMKDRDRLTLRLPPEIMSVMERLAQERGLTHNVVVRQALGILLVAHDAANREWQLELVSQLTERGQVLQDLKRPEEALANFQRVWDISKPQTETAKQYPSWVR